MSLTSHALINVMKQNMLGTTGIQVSEIGFGCMSIGTDEPKAKQLIHTALDAGVTFFDTSDLYDQGLNETLLGKALKTQRSNVILATKVGNRWNADGKVWRWDASPKWIKEAVGHSLRRLQTDYIDLYQLHGGTLEDPLDDIVATFEDLKQAGLIRAYGISSIRPNVIREWLKRSNLSSNMMQYSLLDRRPEEEALSLLADDNVSVIARGPLAKGLLANKAPSAYLDYSIEDVTKIQTGLADLANSGRSKGQVALRYALAHPAVATVIPGATWVAQVQENCAAAEASLTELELATLQNIVKANTYSKHR